MRNRIKNLWQNFWWSFWSNLCKNSCTSFLRVLGDIPSETPSETPGDIAIEISLQKILEWSLEESQEEILAKFLNKLLKLFLELYRNGSRKPYNEQKFRGNSDKTGKKGKPWGKRCRDYDKAYFGDISGKITEEIFMERVSGYFSRGIYEGISGNFPRRLTGALLELVPKFQLMSKGYNSSAIKCLLTDW